MSTKSTGGPAFPRPVSEDRRDGDQFDGNRSVPEQSGMTLREYFAGQVLSGLASTELDFGTVGNPTSPWLWVARQAYEAADAMLKAQEE